MLKQRVVLVAILLLLIFGLGIGLGFLLPHWGKPDQKFYNTAPLLQQVQTLSQLVTVKYVLEKVVVLEVPPGGVLARFVGSDSRVLMVAHGTVKAGIDLNQIKAGDLEVSGKKLLIKLPPAHITDAYLDEKQTHIVERSTGFLQPFDKDLEQTARQNAIDDIGRAARNSGILKDADERARAQLTNLFQQLGFERVEFRR